MFFFQAADISILPYGWTTWSLTKRVETKLDGNYTRMLRAVLKKSWRHQPPITKTIQLRRTRHPDHSWRSTGEYIYIYIYILRNKVDTIVFRSNKPLLWPGGMIIVMLNQWWMFWKIIQKTLGNVDRLINTPAFVCFFKLLCDFWRILNRNYMFNWEKFRIKRWKKKKKDIWINPVSSTPQNSWRILEWKFLMNDSHLLFIVFPTFFLIFYHINLFYFISVICRTLLFWYSFLFRLFYPLNSPPFPGLSSFLFSPISSVFLFLPSFSFFLDRLNVQVSIKIDQFFNSISFECGV